MARSLRGHEEHEMSLLLNEDETGSKEKLRLMVIGRDDALMDKACASILGERQNRDAFKFGILEPRKAQVRGRQVSVLKTPPYWLKYLKSFRVFVGGIKAIRNDMEFCESLMFPGPHAFLLVHRDVKNSGREDYLLQALSEVFGMEVLDYCMVLFIDRARPNDPTQNSCVKMCGRHHTLHNTDDSVIELFKKIEKMTEGQDSTFFTTHPECFRKASNYFQEEYKEKENKLIKDSKDRESQLNEELNDLKEKANRLNKKLKDSEEKENQMREKFRTSSQREKQLNEELIICKDKERQLNQEKNDLKTREKQLEEELNDSKEEERRLRKELNDSKEEEKKLRKELKDSKEKEKQLRIELNDSNDRLIEVREKFCTSIRCENQLREELSDSKDREEQLRKELNDLKGISKASFE